MWNISVYVFLNLQLLVFLMMLFLFFKDLICFLLYSFVCIGTPLFDIIACFIWYLSITVFKGWTLFEYNGAEMAMIPIPWNVPLPSIVTILWSTLSAMNCVTTWGNFRKCFRSIYNSDTTDCLYRVISEYDKANHIEKAH